MLRGFATDVTDGFFLAGDLLLWGGWVLLPRRVGILQALWLGATGAYLLLYGIGQGHVSLLWLIRPAREFSMLCPRPRPGMRRPRPRGPARPCPIGREVT